MMGGEISPHSREPRYWNFDVRSDSIGWIYPAKLAVHDRMGEIGLLHSRI